MDRISGLANKGLTKLAIGKLGLANMGVVRGDRLLDFESGLAPYYMKKYARKI